VREIEDKIAQIKRETSHDDAKSRKAVERGCEIKADGTVAHRKKLAALSKVSIRTSKKHELEEQKRCMRSELEAAEGRSARGGASD